MPQQSTSETRHVTLATIAEHLGVSRMTVSNAYNRPDQLSSELRRRVLAAAEELGYAGPDPVARTLKRGRTGTLGILFDDPLTYAFTDPAAVLFLQGVAGACEAHGSGLLIVPLSPDEGGLQSIRTAMVDGFIAYCDSEGDPRIAAIEHRGVPFVMADGPSRPGVPSVGVDDRTGARAAAQHLCDLGHRNVAILAFPLVPDGQTGPVDEDRLKATSYFVTKQRLRGYFDALGAIGLNPGLIRIEEVSRATFDAGRVASAMLLDRAPRPAAILAMSDELALGALSAAHERGIRVPDQLSIVGFDDAPPAARATPPLTTVYQDHSRKGELAARLLLEADEGPPRNTLLPAELIVRASSAPAPFHDTRR